MFQNAQRHILPTTRGAGSRVVREDIEATIVKEFGEWQHLVLSIAITTRKNDKCRATTAEESSIEEDLVHGAHVNPFRMEIRVAGEAPSIPRVRRMQGALRSNPADNAECY